MGQHMAKIAELRSKKDKLVKEARTLFDAAPNGQLEGAAAERFQAIGPEIDAIERQIESEQRIAEWERQTAADPVSPARDSMERELRSVSLRTLIASMIPDIAHTVDAGREREVSQELARRAGRPVQGALFPMEVFQIPRDAERRVVTSTAPVAGPGGNLIPTEHMASEYIDILRARLITRGLGARVLSNLRGNIDIPRLKASAAGHWVAENSAITPSDPQFEKVQLTPKHVGAITEFSRNMLLQSSPDIEQLLRADFAAVLAEAIDRAAILGGGANEPDGILVTAGVGTFDIDPVTWPAVLEAIADIEGANADIGALAWATNPQAVKVMRGTLKETGDAGAGYIMERPRELAGYALASSNVVGAGTSPDTAPLIFGNWSDLLIGYWSAFEILVNPYESTAYAKGNVQVRGIITADVAVRHPESFTAGSVPF